jgi:ferrous iron transport protein B
VGTVVSFFPILVIFFVVLGALEDVGYMARGAYIMDRFMHLLGLHGKSFLPLFLGFGCNVPAVLGARVIESEHARVQTILLAPLVPCTARMAVVAFLAPAFFTAPTLVSWGLLLINLMVLAVAGWVMSRVSKGEHVAFIMELPLYHLPNLRTIALTTWQRLQSFLRKAGTVILAVSVIIWALSTLPHGNIDSSFLASFGRLLEPIGRWMGLDWRMIVALLSSLVAKENSIAALGVLFGADSQARLVTVLRATLTPAAALAFLVTEMLFMPCVATVAAIRQETNSLRWPIFSVLALTLISLAGGVLTYQVATWLSRW